MPKKQQQAEQSSRLMTIKEVMDALSVSRWTVEKLAAEGELERKKIRRAVRITRESFEQFVKNL